MKMILQPDIFNKAHLLLSDASTRVGSPLRADEIEALAVRTGFCISVQRESKSRIEFIRHIKNGPSSLALATSIASRVRGVLNVGNIEPLFDLPILLDSELNIGVFPIEPETALSGSLLFKGTGFIFLPRTRQIEDLFLCAHQLAHIVLISLQKNPEGAVFDLFRTSTTTRSPHEYFADAFARELLVPSDGLALAIQETRKQLKVRGGPLGDIEILYLARIFGVEFLVAAKRCEQLGLLPKGGAIALHKFLEQEFGGAEKRAQILDLPARPDIDIPSVPHAVQIATIQYLKANRLTTQRAVFATSDH